MVTQSTQEQDQQLLQTVEMFEAITGSQPDDYQSLEILKEAYVKLGQPDDLRRVSMRLARAYANVGQISQAILEYEGILQRFPDDAEVTAALTILEQKTKSFIPSSVAGLPSDDADSKRTSPAPAVTAGAGAPRSSAISGPGGAIVDGDFALAELLVAEKLLTTQSVQPLLQQIRDRREEGLKKGQPVTLAQTLMEQQLMKIDDLLLFMINKAGLPYLPLSVYDLDRDVACLLPRELAFSLCMVPFDIIGRSALVATANPFDQAGRNQVQSMLNYNIFWFITSPAEIVAGLRRVYGMDGRSTKGH